MELDMANVKSEPQCGDLAAIQERVWKLLLSGATVKLETRLPGWIVYWATKEKV